MDARMNRKGFVAMTGAAGLAAFLAACGGSSSDSGDGGGAASSTEAAKAVATATDALTWNKRIVKALVGLTAVAGTALAFAFTVARSTGDAAGEKRERDAQRLRYIALIDQLVRDVARHDGQLGSVLDALRTRYPIGAVPLLGPPNQDPPP